jgi:hypothetical protein
MGFNLFSDIWKNSSGKTEGALALTLRLLVVLVC